MPIRLGYKWDEIMKKCFFARSNETELWFNLALEAYLLSTAAVEQNLLYLWQNDRCVVIGRYQNPWAECCIENLRRDNVMLGRRPSGGGAVYQDMGNGCFTFACPKDQYDKDENFGIVADSLENLKIRCQRSGRNDIMVNDRKVSGSAFQFGQRFASYHATMLVSASLSKVGDYLTPNQTKLQSKGVKSVASRIANLEEFSPGITVSDFYDSLWHSYSRKYGDAVKVREFSKADMDSIPELAELYGKFSSAQWIYGKSPEFTDRVEGRIGMGCVSFCLNVVKGCIVSASVYSDTLECGVVEKLEKLLVGCLYERQRIQSLSAGQEGLVEEALEFLSAGI